MLQCVAVCCHVLQYVPIGKNLFYRCITVCCSVLQCVAVRPTLHVCFSVLQCVTVCCSVLQCVAVRPILHVCCSVLQCASVRSDWECLILQVWCNVLQ